MHVPLLLSVPYKFIVLVVLFISAIILRICNILITIILFYIVACWENVDLWLHLSIRFTHPGTSFCWIFLSVIYKRPRSCFRFKVHLNYSQDLENYCYYTLKLSEKCALYGSLNMQIFYFLFFVSHFFKWKF